MISAPFSLRDVTLTLHYPGWSPLRFEHRTDGATVIQFGFLTVSYR